MKKYKIGVGLGIFLPIITTGMLISCVSKSDFNNHKHTYQANAMGYGDRPTSKPSPQK